MYPPLPNAASDPRLNWTSNFSHKGIDFKFAAQMLPTRQPPPGERIYHQAIGLSATQIHTYVAYWTGKTKENSISKAVVELFPPHPPRPCRFESSPLQRVGCLFRTIEDVDPEHVSRSPRWLILQDCAGGRSLLPPERPIRRREPGCRTATPVTSAGTRCIRSG